MLDLSFNFCRFYRTACKFLFLSLISIKTYSFEYADGLINTPKHFEHEWVSRYLNSLDPNATIEEMVDFLVSLRISLLSKGFNVPTLSDLCARVKNFLLEENIPFDEEDFNAVFYQINTSEECLEYFYSNFRSNEQKLNKFEFVKKKQSKGEPKLSSKTTFGLIKCLGGGLLCIIPFPAVQAVGAGLILNGVNDCIDSAREQGDENEKLRSNSQQQKIEN